MSTESLSDEHARHGVTETHVEKVADELSEQLDRNVGDTVNVRNKRRFAKKSGVEIPTNRVGMALRELERQPRYGVVVEQVNPGAIKSSWTATRGDSA